jgi:hypothetical protein
MTYNLNVSMENISRSMSNENKLMASTADQTRQDDKDDKDDQHHCTSVSPSNSDIRECSPPYKGSELTFRSPYSARSLFSRSQIPRAVQEGMEH